MFAHTKNNSAALETRIQRAGEYECEERNSAGEWTATLLDVCLNNIVDKILTSVFKQYL